MICILHPINVKVLPLLFLCTWKPHVSTRRVKPRAGCLLFIYEWHHYPAIGVVLQSGVISWNEMTEKLLLIGAREPNTPIVYHCLQTNYSWRRITTLLRLTIIMSITSSVNGRVSDDSKKTKSFFYYKIKTCFGGQDQWAFTWFRVCIPPRWL